MKEQFLKNEIWMLTYGASFQRAYAYIDNASEETKRHFKTKTSGLIDNMLPQYKKGNVTDEEHITNIKEVSNYSNHFSEIFNCGQINFGIAQKMLNLYLKYQWCLGNIAEPPHFPVDRIIQQELNKIAKKHNLSSEDIKPWTQFKDASSYKNVIDFAKRIRDNANEYNGFTLAQLELTLFDRR